MTPDSLDVFDGPDLILATDGFWADLSVDDQIRFMQDGVLPGAASGDDCSLLIIGSDSGPDGPAILPMDADDAFYVRVQAPQA